MLFVLCCSVVNQVFATFRTGRHNYLAKVISLTKIKL